MIRACALAGLAAVLSGCTWPHTTWKGTVEWPYENDPSVKPLIPVTEAGASLAAAGAIRELIRTNKDPRLFRGCSSPEQGLDVAVFTGPTPGLYYVALDQHFSRCGGPIGRVLDWHHVYAVTPQGEVVAEDPIGPGEAPPAPPPAPTPSAPTPATGADAPTQIPPPDPAPEPSSPSPAPTPPASPSPVSPG